MAITIAYLQYSYLIHPHHRDGRATKSQWTISDKDENKCFRRTFKNSWIVGESGWGIHKQSRVVSYSGIAKDRATQLVFTKFKKDPNQNLWHGYPADQRNGQDIPDIQIQRAWISQKILPTSKLSKIFRGKRCVL